MARFFGKPGARLFFVNGHEVLFLFKFISEVH